MDAPQSIDDRFGPLEVFLLTRHGPVRWSASRDVPQITYFVGQFDKLCLPTDVRGMLDLETLSLSLRQRLVVCDFEHELSDLFPEEPNQFLCGRLSIFKGVVQKRRDQDTFVFYPPFVQENVGKRYRVIDVGGCEGILASLGTMFVCGKSQRL
jgi:hypothetical protein